MNKWNKRIWILLLVVWFGCVGVLPASTVLAAAVPPFEQGAGYQAGAYDPDAVQPTAFNWTRQSRFTGSPNYDERWSFDTGGWVHSSFAIGSDDTIYIGSQDGKVYALDPDPAATQRVKWSFQTGDWVRSSPAIGKDGTIYIGSWDGQVYALNPDPAAINRVKWSFSLGDPIAREIYTSPAIGMDGIIYIVSGYGKVFALDPDPAATQRVKWSDSLGGEIETSPVIGSDGTIYVGSSDKKVYALNPNPAATQRIIWSYETGGKVVSSPAIGSDGTIYVGSREGKMYALDPDPSTTKRVKWSFELGEIYNSSPTIGSDGTIYVGSWDGRLYAFDSDPNSKRRVKWSFETEYGINAPAIGSDGTIYIGSENGKVYAIGTNAPNIPTNLQATAEAGKVKLNWEGVAHADSYKVYKYEGTAAPANPNHWVLVNDTEPLTETTFTVEGLTAGTVYWFAVKAVNIGGESGYSAPVTATPYTTVSVVDPIDPIRVAKGMKLVELPFPEEVRVHLADGSDILSSVVWDLVNSDYDAGQVGTYTVSGELQLPQYIYNPQDKQAEVSVIVLPNTNARLSSIELNGEPLEGFKPEIFSYSILVPFATEQVSVTAATYDPQATYEVSGGMIHHLQVGNNRIEIVVTAEDEEEQREYTINVEREADGEAPWWPNGSKLTLSDITQTSVKLSWPQATDNVAVTGYRLYVDGDKKVDEASSVFDYSVTDSVYSYTMMGLVPGTSYDFIVTAYDAENNESDPGLSGTATTLSRSRSSGGGSYLSSNANLRILQIWDGDNNILLTPTFAADILAYTAETKAAQVELKAFAANTAAKVTWQDQVLRDGIRIDLQEGENLFELIVQAEDGSKTKYTLSIHRKPSTPEPLITFIDISGHWAESFIKRAALKGIVSGYPDGTFKPDHPVTRVEFTTMIVRALKLQGEGTLLPFTDREQIGSWAQQAIAQAVQAGIVAGYEDGTFRPDAYITRAEMAVMIARALKLSHNVNAVTSFVDDDDIPQWAKDRVAALHELDIVAGRNNNRFAPNELSTRAEAAVMLLRMLEIHK